MDPTDPVFDLMVPDDWTGVIVASPHSGRLFPADFLASTACLSMQLRRSEDALLDQIAAPARRHGAAVLTARVSRAAVDLNRGANELDPLLVDGVPRRPMATRVQSGLGVLPRIVGRGQMIYPHGFRLTRQQAHDRIARLWRPYHDALENLMARACAAFGSAVLIDLHSMPHEALADMRAPLPDIVLGNRHGVSAGAQVSNAVQSALTAQGFRLRRNRPFSGAYIASAYGDPRRKRHVVQLELDRYIYLDASGLRPGPGYDDVANRLALAFADLPRIAQISRSQRLAAE